jgi:hypothetical protein
MSTETTELTIRVPRQALHVATFRDPRDNVIRFDLRQVRFGRDKDGGYAAATNSKVLAVARWEDPDGQPCEFGVAGWAVAAALEAAASLGGYFHEATASPGRIVVTGRPTTEFKRSHTFSDAAEISKFPDFQSIIDNIRKKPPVDDPGQSRADPAMWVQVGTLFGLVTGEQDDPSVRILHTGTGNPILFESAVPGLAPWRLRLTALLMTIRED